MLKRIGTTRGASLMRSATMVCGGLNKHVFHRVGGHFGSAGFGNSAIRVVSTFTNIGLEPSPALGSNSKDPAVGNSLPQPPNEPAREMPAFSSLSRSPVESILQAQPTTLSTLQTPPQSTSQPSSSQPSLQPSQSPLQPSQSTLQPSFSIPTTPPRTSSKSVIDSFQTKQLFSSQPIHPRERIPSTPPTPQNKGNLVDISAIRSDNNTKFARNIDSWTDTAFLDTGYRGNIVVSGNKKEDLQYMVNHYTAPALARALRNREITLSKCAKALKDKDLDQLKDLLMPFLKLPSVHHTKSELGLDKQLPKKEEGGVFSQQCLERLSTRLNRLPRHITVRAQKRASVIVPLCHVDGEPSVLFTQRSYNLNRHKGEVCFPGGMADPSDRTIVDAGLRELTEETGISADSVKVLGILRCDWSEVHSITGVSVTPIIGYVGDFENLQLHLNEGEVRHCFTVPVSQMVDKSAWTLREFSTPVFRPAGLSNEHVVFGLTAYILERLIRLLPYVVFKGKEHRLLYDDIQD